MTAASSGSNQAIYVISVAAELSGMHPQTLRVYERKGLLSPQRTAGNTRRYSQRDIDRLRKIQDLTQMGVNLAGVVGIMELERRLERSEADLQAALEQLEAMEQRMEELLGARDQMALVPLRDVRRIRRAMKSDRIEQARRARIFAAPPASMDER